MILHDMGSDDVLSLSMFWAGLLMVLAPMLFAAVVLAVWWRQRTAPPGAAAGDGRGAPENDGA